MELTYYEQINRIKGTICRSNSSIRKKISALLMLKEISILLKNVDNMITKFDGMPDYYQPLSKKVNMITKDLYSELFDIIDNDDKKSEIAYNKVKLSIAKLAGIVSEYKTINRLK